MSITDLRPASANALLARSLVLQTGISYIAFLEVIIRKPKPRSTWRTPTHSIVGGDRNNRITSLQERITEFSDTTPVSQESLAQLSQLGQQYLQMAAAGEEFSWLSKRIPPDSDFYRNVQRQWNACMIHHISLMGRIQELQEAYHLSPRLGQAKQYALYRMVEVAKTAQ